MRKLVIKKTTVANLNSKEMNEAKGGTAIWISIGCSIYPQCAPRPYDPIDKE